MSKKTAISQNYLEKVPTPKKELKWSLDSAGRVELSVENVGFFNKTAQKLFKRPKVSYIQLDETGSFVWELMDGCRDIAGIAEMLNMRFGKELNPLYERLAQFFQILDNNGFIEWRCENK